MLAGRVAFPFCWVEVLASGDGRTIRDYATKRRTAHFTGCIVRHGNYTSVTLLPIRKVTDLYLASLSFLQTMSLITCTAPPATHSATVPATFADTRCLCPSLPHSRCSETETWASSSPLLPPGRTRSPCSLPGALDPAPRHSHTWSFILVTL